MKKIRDEACQGKYHGGHAGFPCTTFTQLRWRAAPGMPGPVRSRHFIYGLPTNNKEQQDEADKGTLIACQAIQILGDIEASSKGDGIPRPATAENPPKTDHPSFNLLDRAAGHGVR